MTRKDILQILLLQAKSNGFEFRRWYRKSIDTPWEDFDSALTTLTSGKRYYTLLFSHDFASTFWKPGAQISFIVPTSTYTRKNKSGEMITITRKAFTRRTLKVDSWRYHLREMAVAPEPLRYIQRFIIRKEDLERYQAQHAGTTEMSFLEDVQPSSKTQ